MTGYFQKLSKQRQYDLMGALRGPDTMDVTLKRVVTGRVRYIIFGRIELAVWESQQVDNADLDTVRTKIKGLPGPNKHYFKHLLAAVKASKGHRIWGGRADELIKALKEGV